MKSFVISALIASVLAAPARVVEERAAAPHVTIASPSATIVGASLLDVDTFNGIPFAQPPVGALRLKAPQPLTASLGTVNAVGIPKACPQLLFSDSVFPSSVLGNLLDIPLLQKVTDAGEDCLTINVNRPAGTVAGDNLPVLFWIFGGGFELGKE